MEPIGTFPKVDTFTAFIQWKDTSNTSFHWSQSDLTVILRVHQFASLIRKLTFSTRILWGSLIFAQRRNRSSPHPLLPWLYHSNGCPHIEHPNTGAFLSFIYCVLQIPKAAQLMCMKEEQFKTCYNRFVKPRFVVLSVFPKFNLCLMKVEQLTPCIKHIGLWNICD